MILHCFTAWRDDFCCLPCYMHALCFFSFFFLFLFGFLRHIFDGTMIMVASCSSLVFRLFIFWFIFQMVLFPLLILVARISTTKSNILLYHLVHLNLASSTRQYRVDILTCYVHYFLYNLKFHTDCFLYNPRFRRTSYLNHSIQ